ncbi:MAG: hypothetical protein QNJ16_03335 [Rhodobacter sp.]|nr:hypothetical protein [Rhodobacter sp.]
MTDITELERRITAALDRIGAGVDQIASAPAEPQVDPDEVQALRDALEAEKTANAQLEERIKALHTQLDGKVGDLEQKLGAAEAGRRDAASQAAALRKANQHLQSSVQGLRDAAAGGVTEPHLINQAMTSELEGLRALRDGDRAELDAILSELKPLLGEARDA